MNTENIFARSVLLVHLNHQSVWVHWRDVLHALDVILLVDKSKVMMKVNTPLDFDRSYVELFILGVLVVDVTSLSWALRMQYQQQLYINIIIVYYPVECVFSP